MTRHYLIDRRTNRIVDAARLGVPGASRLDAIRCHPFGAAIAIMASAATAAMPGDLPGRRINMSNNELRHSYVPENMNIRDVLGSRFPNRALKDALEVLYPRTVDDLARACDTSRGAFMTRLEPRTSDVIGLYEAATGRFVEPGRTEPLLGFRPLRPDEVGAGKKVIIYNSSEDTIVPERWPGIEAPTIAGIVRSRTLCAAIAMLCLGRPEGVSSSNRFAARWEGSSIYIVPGNPSPYHRDITERVAEAVAPLLN